MNRIAIPRALTAWITERVYQSSYSETARSVTAIYVQRRCANQCVLLALLPLLRPGRFGLVLPLLLPCASSGQWQVAHNA